MNTKRRLDQVFEKAFPIPFDNSSKFVFFSDMHRGDDSLADEFGRNRHIYDHALMYYYDSDFTYVEVGDGDELIEQANFKRIYSSHPWTFELLKQFFDDNRMVMLFGNHNFQLANPNFVQRNYYHTYDDYTDSFEPLFPGIHVHESVLLTHRETDQKFRCPWASREFDFRSAIHYFLHRNPLFLAIHACPWRTLRGKPGQKQGAPPESRKDLCQMERGKQYHDYLRPYPPTAFCTSRRRSLFQYRLLYPPPGNSLPGTELRKDFSGHLANAQQRGRLALYQTNRPPRPCSY